MGSHDEKLQRLHDGELTPSEAEALHLALTDADREKLLALAEIDELVGNAVMSQAGEVDLWQAIQAKLPPQAAQPVTTASHQATVHAFSPARRRLMGRATAVVSALAMAAAFAFWLMPAAPQTNHCDIESLEVAGGSATVLKVSGDRGDATTVLWVDHDEGDEWETL